VTVGLTLSSPGVYYAPAITGPPALSPVALDETGFVGVCWRGPVQTPFRVTSWSQFVDVFGGLQAPDGRACPGYLPIAVRAFFEQGGRVAWVVRVAPVVPDEGAAARLDLGLLGVTLQAASEGSWGSYLTASWSYESGPALPDSRVLPPQSGFSDAPVLAAGQADLPTGTLLRFGRSRERPAGSSHWLVDQRMQTMADGSRLRLLALDPPPPSDDIAPDVRVVTGTLDVLDRDPGRRRSERIRGLGLHPDHPRYPAALEPPDHPRHGEMVLAVESMLVRPAGVWRSVLAPADTALPVVSASAPTGGADRFDEIGADSLFDSDSPRGDPLDERTDHRGVDALARVDTLGLLCVPDLTWSGRESAGAARHLDPHTSEGLAEVVARQQALVAVAATRQRFVALLDAPLRTTVEGLTRWRAAFDSSYAAAYHPWLAVPSADPRQPADVVPPSAFAAGVIAARERRLGLAWGPANELAATAVLGLDVIPQESLGELHRAGVNVFHTERDGLRLTSARTLSNDRRLEQLPVRRLMTMIVVSLSRFAAPLVFEPHNPTLRALLVHTVTQFLRALFAAGALAGDTEETSFFVRCDDALNPVESVSQGRLVAEVGIALAAPLEFLVVRINQDADGRTQVLPTGPGATR
jgi:hypothetical protein